MYSLHKCKINSKAKELELNVVSKTGPIPNMQLKWKQSNFLLWNHKLKKTFLLERNPTFVEEKSLLNTIKRKTHLHQK